MNLYQKGTISLDSILLILETLMKNMGIMIEEENKQNEVNEITENIAIIYLVLKKENNLEHIKEKIDFYSKCKSKTYPSLSQKSIFKFMDLV